MSTIKSNRDMFPAFVSDFFNSDRFFSPSRLFEKPFEEFFPAVNIKENGTGFHIELAAPGFEKGDFKIHVEGDMLNISAEKKQEQEDKNEKYTRKEYSYNSFSRSFNLPKNSNGEQISAQYENGILKLQLPKKEISQASGKKEIPVS